VDCLDANDVQDLMAGSASDERRRAVMGHLDTCDDCRDVVAAMARTLTSTGAPLPAASIDPTRLGRYTIVGPIGRGAMGAVYRATDPELSREVAVKRLHRNDPMLTERLVREARSMAQLSHPNVVQVYDVGVDGESPYIAMELVPGGSLREWLQAPRTVREIVRAFVEAGRGLAAAHAAGIVHRDFKPDNCLVGADGRVRVTDFGLAALRPIALDEPPPDDLELTRAGTALGTPAYMAPEQFLAGNIDPRTDQFSFCVALFEALYGRRPFTGKTFEELADNVIDGVLAPAPADPERRVSPAVRRIILRGLSVKPGDRFPTMDALIDELRRDRARPWRRASIAATFVAIVLLLGLVADFAVRDRVASQIAQAFRANGRQVDRAFALLVDRFDVNANQVYNLPIMREVAGRRPDNSFGLGDSAPDESELVELHEKLRSQDWTLVKHANGIIAVLDRDGLLLFTSAGDGWRQDLKALPWVKRVIDRGAKTAMALVRADDPALVASGLLGAQPPTGLVFVFVRALVLAGEVGTMLVQVLPAAAQIDAIRIDETLISLVSKDRAIGDVPEALASAVVGEAGVVERRAGDTRYDLQSLPMRGFDGETIGHVVLARPKVDVLSLFPGARVTFAGALGLAIAVAFATRMRARARDA